MNQKLYTVGSCDNVKHCLHGGVHRYYESRIKLYLDTRPERQEQVARNKAARRTYLKKKSCSVCGRLGHNKHQCSEITNS